MTTANTGLPVELWTRLRSCADLVDAVMRRHATLDRRGWEQLAGELMSASTQCKVLAELAQPRMETRVADPDVDGTVG